jgi:hypothetical protein
MLTDYPGVLMEDKVLEQFNAEYHCPTIVQVPSLNSAPGVSMNLVGDPTLAGPIVNDGDHSSHASQLGSPVVWQSQAGIMY